MPTNVFDLIDSAFRSFIFLLYSFVSSVWLALIRPMRAPVLLLRTYRDPKLRQLSAPTLLVLLYFIAIASVPAIWGKRTGEEIIDAASNTTLRDGSAPDVALYTLGEAFVATVVLDATVRLLVKLASPASLRRRQLLAHQLGYALVLPLSWLAFGFWIVGWASRPMSDWADGLLVSVVVWTLLLLLAAMPAAWHVARRLRRNVRPSRRRLWPLLIVPVAVYVVACLAPADEIVGEVRQRREAAMAAADGTKPLAVLDLVCIIGRQPQVRVLVANNDAKARLIDEDWTAAPADEVRVEDDVPVFRLAAPSRLAVSRPADVPRPVIRPGETAVVDAPIVPPLDPAWRTAQECYLKRPGLDDETGRVVRPRADAPHAPRDR